MANELTVFQPDRYPALIEGSDIREALQANLRGGALSESDLVRVPTPTSGATRWVVPTISGEEVLEEIVGILVYFAPRGTLWPSLETTGNSKPLLVSNDLQTATRQGDDYGDIDPDEMEKHRLDDGTYNWETLPWNQWGTGKNGHGKRCKESRLLMVLRENEPFPLLIRAQPGSLKTIRPFIMRLPVPHYRAVVGLSLRKERSTSGNDFAQIVPRLVCTLDREAGEAVKRLYTTPLAALTAGSLRSDRDD